MFDWHHRGTDRPYDFENDKIFDGYDPVEDGFAYPMADVPERIIAPGCVCQIGETYQYICNQCIDRLLNC